MRFTRQKLAKFLAYYNLCEFVLSSKSQMSSMVPYMHIFVINVSFSNENILIYNFKKLLLEYDLSENISTYIVTVLHSLTIIQMHRINFNFCESK